MSDPTIPILAQTLRETLRDLLNNPDYAGDPYPHLAEKATAVIRPLIESSVRAKIADEIEALGRHTASDPATISTLAVAAAIARGDQ